MIEDGPPGWRTWRAAINAGTDSSNGWEALLYTDIFPIGEVTNGLGPFQLFSTMAEPLTGGLAPRLVLRVQYHDAGPAPELSKSKIKKEGNRWLALSVDAELACLLSLVLGCRIRSGGKVRTFSAENRLGRPAYAEHIAPAALVPAYRISMIPGLAGRQLSMSSVRASLAQYPALKAQDAIALIRAARHYATALWIADNDPEQAWLQLVSALEAVAAQWKSATSDPVELFTEHFAEPARLICETADGSDLLAAISPHFTRLIGAVRRFEDFVLTFKPDPPHDRPTTAQVDWSNLRPTMKTIYQHRSRLLHNGTPFPADLCVPPIMIDGVPEEKPIGISSTAGNTTWTAAETPIRLHTFAHIVRGAILQWWNKGVTHKRS
jgi:hypothetical protein